MQSVVQCILVDADTCYQAIVVAVFYNSFVGQVIDGSIIFCIFTASDQAQVVAVGETYTP